MATTRKFQPIRAPVKKLKQEDTNESNTQEHMNHLPQDKIGRGILKKNARSQQAEVKELHKGHDGQDDAFDFDNLINQQTVAMDTLKNGYIQAFIDFFYITSHTLPEIIKPSARYIEEVQNKKKDLPKLGETEEELKDLKKRLISAEENCRFSDKSGAIEEYSSIAEDFASEKYQDYQSAAYFYKRCASISKQSNDAKWECLSYRGLGNCFSKLDRSDEAIEYLELAIKKAEENNQMHLVIEISQDLVKIYGEMAAMYEKQNDEESIKLALHYLKKCLDSSILGKNQDYEGKICHKIGLIHLNRHEYEDALQYQLKDLELAKKAYQDTDRIREIEAHSALAQTYLNLNRIDNALVHLEEFYKIADKKKLNYQAEAALNLAKVHAQKGNQQKSLDYYNKHFECARLEKKEKDRKLLDKARVILGVARANGGMNGYLKVVQNSGTSLKDLLDSKTPKKDKQFFFQEKGRY